MSSLLCRTLPLPTRTAVRAFSSTTPRCISLQLDKNDPEAVADTVPTYPYGPARWYKQSDLGLYGGQRIQFGNNVGPKSKKKTRRTWNLNVFNKRLYSRALDRHIQLRVTTRVLRTIDKLGGLDNYLLGDKDARIKELGMTGWWLRWAIMQTPEIRSRFEEERIALGLPAKGVDEMIEEEKAAMPDDIEMVPPAQLDAADGEDIVLDPDMAVEDEALESDGEELLLEQELSQSKDQLSAIAEVTADPAFDSEDIVIESTPLQRLKFRAGPRAHLRLTEEGWEKTRPSDEIVFKKWFRKTKEEYRDVREDQTEIAFREFDTIVEKHKLSPREKQSLRARLKHEVDKRAEAVVEAAWKRFNAKRAISGIMSRKKMVKLHQKGYNLPQTRSQAHDLVELTRKDARTKQNTVAAAKAEREL